MMNSKTKIVTSATLGALCALGIAGCSAAGEESVGSSAQELITGTVGTTIYGSDTLYKVVTDVFPSNADCNGLTYVGTGSGNGEKCLRGVGCPTSGGQQLFAPMSRALTSAGSQAGEVNKPIGLDGIGVWKKNDGTATDQTLAQVKAMYCGTGAGVTGCTASPEGGKKYRRDDLSGTTDVFKAITGCTAFCSDVCIVTDPVGTTPPQTICGTTTSSPAVCSAANSATECIARLIANDGTAIAYAGAGAQVFEPSNIKAVGIDGGAGAGVVAFSEANIRKLITDPPNRYPLSRLVFMNTNSTNLGLAATTNELRQKACYNWLVNTNPITGGAKTLETKLVADGFFKCNLSQTLDCQ